MKKRLLIIDLGTTQVRAGLVAPDGVVAALEYRPIPTSFPQPGWVEQDPEALWEAVVEVAGRVLPNRSTAPDILGLGITNQRATLIVWEKETGRPVYPAIVWQDRRNREFTDKLTGAPLRDELRRRTGIVPSGMTLIGKLCWMLDTLPGLRQRAEKGEVLAGTPDTWLLWRITGGKTHATDYSNAAIIGLFNLQTREWDGYLLEKLGIPKSLLPAEIKPSGSDYGSTSVSTIGLETPIAAVAGDQHAAMLGYGSVSRGQANITMGTGAFLLINTGEEALFSAAGLATRVAFATQKEYRYALEGTIADAGTSIELLVGLGILSHVEESSSMACSVPDTGGLICIPAFTGLGCPHWDDTARGAILGLTRGTKRAHIVRAFLESVGYQVEDIFQCLQRELSFRVTTLRAGGGMARNDFAMQFLADITGIEVQRAAHGEASVVGAALLAALSLGIIPGLESVSDYFIIDRVFRPRLDQAARGGLYGLWQNGLARIKSDGRHVPSGDS